MGCNQAIGQKGTALEGKFIGWMWLDGKYVEQNGKMSTYRSITLNRDGTFLDHTSTTTMMILNFNARGKFTVNGDRILMKGTADAYSDDGYHKGSSTFPYERQLRIVDGMLTEIDAKNDPYYFRKEGTGAPAIPSELKLKASDPKAVALLRKVEQTYASLSAYKDHGTMTSKGGGFAAESVKFGTSFSRPSNLHFSAAEFDGEKPFKKVDIRWDGKRAMWTSDEFGKAEDRELKNVLSIVSVSLGDCSTLVPELLLPKVMRFQPFANQYPEIAFLADEMVGKTSCKVVQMKDPSASILKLWIDPSTNLILREYEDIRKTSVTYTIDSYR